MAKNIKLNYMTNADPVTYDTICPKVRANKVGFDNSNSTTNAWGNYTIHNPITANVALSAFEEVQGRISVYGKVCEEISGISGSVVGLVGYGNMAIYVTSSNTAQLNIFNINTSATTTITLPQIDGVTPIIKDIAIIKLDKQTPEVGMLCYVANKVYYVAYDVLSATALNTAVSYSVVSTMVDGQNTSISSRFVRTKKEMVILNGTMGRVDNTYGALGRVMRSVNGETFTVLEKLDGADDSVYLPLAGTLYVGDDSYSASWVVGDNIAYRPLVFTIDGLNFNTHLRFTEGNFNPLGRDLNTGRIMFTTQQGWWQVMPNGVLDNFTTFTSSQIPTTMICVNGLKMTNAGYYYNADGLNNGRALKDKAGNTIAPTASQSLLKFYVVNDKTVFIYAPSTNKWYKTALSTSV